MYQFIFHSDNNNGLFVNIIKENIDTYEYKCHGTLPKTYEYEIDILDLIDIINTIVDIENV